MRHAVVLGCFRCALLLLALLAIQRGALAFAP